jgi:microsomal dipeptidase-like Zn-dependent dipeptidase
VHKINSPSSLQVILKEISRLGMLAEISHLSEPSMMQVLNNAQTPLLVSNAIPSASVLPNVTNLIPDHVLR